MIMIKRWNPATVNQQSSLAHIYVWRLFLLSKVLADLWEGHDDGEISGNGTLQQFALMSTRKWEFQAGVNQRRLTGWAEGGVVRCTVHEGTMNYLEPAWPNLASYNSGGNMRI
jgi:hypothetical protein